MTKKVEVIASIGTADINDCDFIEFNHYTMDECCDMGAMSVSFAAKCYNDIYEFSGDFIVGTEDTITLDVTGVSTVIRDEDGDVTNIDHYPVCGASLTIPYSCILAVMTSVHDTDKYMKDTEAFEALVP